MLTSKELFRYNRHIIMSEIGEEGQEKLKEAKVLVIGAGGLGCPVLQYLAAAGVGTLGIVDFDVVEESNLQRQILYEVNDIGSKKAEVAANKLSRINPYILTHIHTERLSDENALELISGYDIVVDGSDNFPTRYLVNDACVICQKPLVFGSIYKFEGQVSVFNFNNEGSYRCLFPEAPEEGDVPNCSEIGVLGVLPGIIGCLQANEVLKIILGIGEVLAGKLLTMDAFTLEVNKYNYKKRKENFEIKELSAPEYNCRRDDNNFELLIETASELQALRNDKNIQIIDVREKHEYEKGNIGGTHLPLATIRNSLHLIEKEKKIILVCQSGMRSKKALLTLREEYNFNNVWNLSGGINYLNRIRKSLE